MTENSKEMDGDDPSNDSHISRKPLQCIHVITPYAGHIVEVTLQSHSSVNDLFSDTTCLSDLQS